MAVDIAAYELQKKTLASAVTIPGYEKLSKHPLIQDI